MCALQVIAALDRGVELRWIPFVAALIATGCAAGASAPSSSWPAVEPVRRLFRVDDPRQAVVKTTFRSVAGEDLYLFICRTADDPVAARMGINYAGDLDCRLMDSAAGEVETNLLVETEHVAAWYSRGRMFAEQLHGDCGDYPEYGTRRTFLLRGMRLELKFADIRFAGGLGPRGRQSPPLLSYSLTVSVAQEPLATRPIAASSGYLDPLRVVDGRQRGCSVVLRGKEWE